MKCKKHLCDYSSTVGVCASCLRDRLFVIIAAQAEAQAQAQSQAHLSRALSRVDDQSRKSDPHPPPLIFPRSVSPYICHRKSDDDVWNIRSRRDDYHRPQHDLLFFSTPQLGPTFRTTSTFVSSGSKRQKSRLSNWKNLFRFRSENSESDPAVPSRKSCDIASTSSPSNSASTSSSSPSWFSSIFSSHRKKKKKKKSRFFSLENSVVAFGSKPFRTVDRGMSPVEETDSYKYFDELDRSPTASGYSSESSQKWRRSPAIAPGSVRRGRPGLNRSVSGFPFCLSPLVRASPNPHWNQKPTPTDMSFSGELRPQMKPHLSTAASFCANRSRKLADFGRANPNR